MQNALKNHNTYMKLQTANVKAYSNEDCCKQRFSPSDCSSNREVIDDSIICAGSTNQPVGICFGDSGGMYSLPPYLITTYRYIDQYIYICHAMWL